MNICTIITEDWVDAHLARWIRYVKKNVPDCKLFLYYCGESMDRKFPGLRDEFEGVCEIPLEGRDQFNRIRMSATTDFGVDSCLYLDADCDVLADLSRIPEEVEGSSLAFVESPALHKDWVSLCKDLGKPEESSWEGNNGLLWMTEDWGDRYQKAFDAVKGKANPRIVGTMAFNWMLRENEGWARLPYQYGVIWWDSAMFKGAKIIQYCNDKGQAKRVAMETEWRASRV